MLTSRDENAHREHNDRPRSHLTCAPHAASANCPAISVFTRWTVPLPTPTSAATLRMPCPALRCSRMAFSTLGATFGRPSFFDDYFGGVEKGYGNAGQEFASLPSGVREKVRDDICDGMWWRWPV